MYHPPLAHEPFFLPGVVLRHVQRWERVTKLYEFILWDDEKDGGSSLLITGDPPERHRLTQPKRVTAFQAPSYVEARKMYHRFMGWTLPPEDEVFDYPPPEFL